MAFNPMGCMRWCGSAHAAGAWPHHAVCCCCCWCCPSYGVHLTADGCSWPIGVYFWGRCTSGWRTTFWMTGWWSTFISSPAAKGPRFPVSPLRGHLSRCGLPSQNGQWTAKQKLRQGSGGGRGKPCRGFRRSEERVREMTRGDGDAQEAATERGGVSRPHKGSGRPRTSRAASHGSQFAAHAAASGPSHPASTVRTGRDSTAPTAATASCSPGTPAGPHCSQESGAATPKRWRAGGVDSGRSIALVLHSSQELSRHVQWVIIA